MVNELYQFGAEIGEVAQRFNIPRTTLYTWDKQLNSDKDKNVSSTVRGKHMKAGSGRKLSYPKEVEYELC